MKTQYAMIGSRYAGATAELQKKIQELKDRIKDLESEVRIAALEWENDRARLQNKVDILTIEKQNEIHRASLENENFQLKIQLLTGSNARQ
jgi:regulator of replication initiation timing